MHLPEVASAWFSFCRKRVGLGFRPALVTRRAMRVLLSLKPIQHLPDAAGATCAAGISDLEAEGGPPCPMCTTHQDCDDDDCCTHDFCHPEHPDANSFGCVNIPLLGPSQGCTSAPSGGCYVDLDGNGSVDSSDLFCMLDAVSGFCDTTCSSETWANTDISPCQGDNQVNLTDLLEFMDVLGGQPGVICPSP